MLTIPIKRHAEVLSLGSRICLEPFLRSREDSKMKQLDVDISPHAFLWDPHMNLADVTFDLDSCDL